MVLSASSPSESGSELPDVSSIRLGRRSGESFDLSHQARPFVPPLTFPSSLPNVDVAEDVNVLSDDPVVEPVTRPDVDSFPAYNPPSPDNLAHDPLQDAGLSRKFIYPPTGFVEKALRELGRPRHYFSYGTNINPATARIEIGQWRSRERARLFGWRWTCTKRRPDSDVFGYANALPCGGKTCSACGGETCWIDGVLYGVSAEQVYFLILIGVLHPGSRSPPGPRSERVQDPPGDDHTLAPLPPPLGVGGLTRHTLHTRTVRAHTALPYPAE